jgi:hypothetical protein
MKGAMRNDSCLNKCLLAGAVALVLSAATVPAGAGQRPVSDFTSRQASWCAVFTDTGVDCAASYYGGPACADGGFAFVAPQNWTDPATGITAAIDSLGFLDEGDFGTSVDESVSESTRPNGFAEVKVMVHTRNALTRA